MPLPGKVERPQRVTRSRRIKAESNAAGPSTRLRMTSGGLWRAVLKLDSEGECAANAARISQTVVLRGAATVFFLATEGGDVRPWTTDLVVDRTGSRRAAYSRCVRPIGAAEHNEIGGMCHEKSSGISARFYEQPGGARRERIPRRYVAGEPGCQPRLYL